MWDPCASLVSLWRDLSLACMTAFWLCLHMAGEWVRKVSGMSSWKGTNPIMTDPSWWPYISLNTSQKLHLQIPLHWGLGLYLCILGRHDAVHSNWYNRTTFLVPGPPNSLQSLHRFLSRDCPPDCRPLLQVYWPSHLRDGCSTVVCFQWVQTCRLRSSHKWYKVGVDQACLCHSLLVQYFRKSKNSKL